MRVARIGYVPADTTLTLAAHGTAPLRIEQVRQNAERMRLLAAERPFALRTVAVGGVRGPNGRLPGAARVDTVLRGPLPPTPTCPGRWSGPAPGRTPGTPW